MLRSRAWVWEHGMKRYSTAALALVLSASIYPVQSFAAEDAPVYDGKLKLTKVSQACIDDGWRKGDGFTLVFRSEVRSSSKTGGGIQLIGYRNAYSMILPNNKALPGGRQSGTFFTTGLSSKVGTYYYDSPFDLVITPSTITDRTKTVRIKGTLKGLAGVPDCTVTVSGSAKLRR